MVLQVWCHCVLQQVRDGVDVGSVPTQRSGIGPELELRCAVLVSTGTATLRQGSGQLSCMLGQSCGLWQGSCLGVCGLNKAGVYVLSMTKVNTRDHERTGPSAECIGELAQTLDGPRRTAPPPCHPPQQSLQFLTPFCIRRRKMFLVGANQHSKTKVGQ